MADEERVIRYAQPLIEDDDREAVMKVLHTPDLTQGPKVEEYEAAFAERVGAKYAIACSSGTAALHLACLAAGVSYESDVVMPPITFIATKNAVKYCGGYACFADIDLRDMLICPSKINTMVYTVITVDYAGQPCDYDEIQKLRGTRTVIADACHSLGATYKGKPVGSLADITCFSTHAIKSITTGEGGMLTTDVARFAEMAISLRNHGRTADGKIVRIGYNYRMTEMQAALGLSQLKKLDKFMVRRQEIADRYREAFANTRGISCLHQHADRTSANHLFVIICEDRDGLRATLKEKNIETQIHYPSLSKDCPVACSMAQKILSLPLHCGLQNNDIEYVIEAVKEAVKKCT